MLIARDLESKVCPVLVEPFGYVQYRLGLMRLIWLMIENWSKKCYPKVFVLFSSM